MGEIVKNFVYPFSLDKSILVIVIVIVIVYSLGQ
jgi:hypothetical protein